MHKIKIANTEFEYLSAYETSENYNNEMRRTLTVTCEAGVIGLTELNALLTKDNLASIELSNDEFGITDYCDGYTIKLECGIKRVLMQAESHDGAAVYEDRLVFKLGRINYRDVDAQQAAAAAERAEAQAAYTAMMTDTLLEV